LEFAVAVTKVGPPANFPLTTPLTCILAICIEATTAKWTEVTTSGTSWCEADWSPDRCRARKGRYGQITVESVI
jgi:hypothetical protein